MAPKYECIFFGGGNMNRRFLGQKSNNRRLRGSYVLINLTFLDLRLHSIQGKSPKTGVFDFFIAYAMGISQK